MRIGFTRLGLGCLMFSATAAAGSGRPLVVEGPLAAGSGSDPITIARSTISREVPATQSLGLEHAFPTGLAGSTRVVTFRQTHHGVPVAFRGAGVVQRADGSAAWAVVRLEDALPDPTPSISAASAALEASARTGLTATASDAKLAILPLATGARLAWVVYPSERVM